MDDSPRREIAGEDDPLDLFASEGPDSAFASEVDESVEPFFEPYAADEPRHAQPAARTYQAPPPAAPRHYRSNRTSSRLVLVASACVVVATLVVAQLLSGGSAETVASNDPDAAPRPEVADSSPDAISPSVPGNTPSATTGAARNSETDRTSSQTRTARDASGSPAAASAGRPAADEKKPTASPDADAAEIRRRETLARSNALLSQGPPAVPSAPVLSDLRPTFTPPSSIVTGASSSSSSAAPSPANATSAAPVTVVESAPTPDPPRTAGLTAALPSGAELDTRGPAAAAGEVARAVPAPAPVPVAVPVRSRDAMIRGVLNEYREAVSALDLAAARAAWPSADARALSRAFEQVEEQKIEFDTCEIKPVGSTASATCVGTIRLIPKYGNRTVRLEKRRWDFKLRELNEAWFIDGINTR